MNNGLIVRVKRRRDQDPTDTICIVEDEDRRSKRTVERITDGLDSTLLHDQASGNMTQGLSHVILTRVESVVPEKNADIDSLTLAARAKSYEKPALDQALKTAEENSGSVMLVTQGTRTLQSSGRESFIVVDFSQLPIKRTAQGALSESDENHLMIERESSVSKVPAASKTVVMNPLERKMDNAIHTAMKTGDFNYIVAALQQGANANQRRTDANGGTTALMAAAKHCHLRMTRQLLAVGVDVLTKSVDGESALDIIRKQTVPHRKAEEKLDLQQMLYRAGVKQLQQQQERREISSSEPRQLASRRGYSELKGAGSRTGAGGGGTGGAGGGRRGASSILSDGDMDSEESGEEFVFDIFCVMPQPSAPLPGVGAAAGGGHSSPADYASQASGSSTSQALDSTSCMVMTSEDVGGTRGNDGGIDGNSAADDSRSGSGIDATVDGSAMGGVALATGAFGVPILATIAPGSVPSPQFDLAAFKGPIVSVDGLQICADGQVELAFEYDSDWDDLADDEDTDSNDEGYFGNDYPEDEDGDEDGDDGDRAAGGRDSDDDSDDGDGLDSDQDFEEQAAAVMGARGRRRNGGRAAGRASKAGRRGRGKQGEEYHLDEFGGDDIGIDFAGSGEEAEVGKLGMGKARVKFSVGDDGEEDDMGGDSDDEGNALPKVDFRGVGRVLRPGVMGLGGGDGFGSGPGAGWLSGGRDKEALQQLWGEDVTLSVKSGAYRGPAGVGAGDRAGSGAGKQRLMEGSHGFPKNEEYDVEDKADEDDEANDVDDDDEEEEEDFGEMQDDENDRDEDDEGGGSRPRRPKNQSWATMHAKGSKIAAAEEAELEQMARQAEIVKAMFGVTPARSRPQHPGAQRRPPTQGQQGQHGHLGTAGLALHADATTAAAGGGGGRGGAVLGSSSVAGGGGRGRGGRGPSGIGPSGRGLGGSASSSLRGGPFMPKPSLLTADSMDALLRAGKPRRGVSTSATFTASAAGGGGAGGAGGGGGAAAGAGAGGGASSFGKAASDSRSTAAAMDGVGESEGGVSMSGEGGDMGGTSITRSESDSGGMGGMNYVGGMDGVGAIDGMGGMGGMDGVGGVGGVGGGLNHSLASKAERSGAGATTGTGRFRPKVPKDKVGKAGKVGGQQQQQQQQQQGAPWSGRGPMDLRRAQAEAEEEEAADQEHLQRLEDMRGRTAMDFASEPREFDADGLPKYGRELSDNEDDYAVLEGVLMEEDERAQLYAQASLAAPGRRGLGSSGGSGGSGGSSGGSSGRGSRGSSLFATRDVFHSSGASSQAFLAAGEGGFGMELGAAMEEREGQGEEAISSVGGASAGVGTCAGGFGAMVDSGLQYPAAKPAGSGVGGLFFRPGILGQVGSSLGQQAVRFRPPLPLDTIAYDSDLDRDSDDEGVVRMQDAEGSRG